MDSTSTDIDGLLVIDLAVHSDDRGWFKENWQCQKMLGSACPTSADAARRVVQPCRRHDLLLPRQCALVARRGLHLRQPAGPTLSVLWAFPAQPDVVPVRPPGTLVIGAEGQPGRALRGGISESANLAASDLDLTDTAAVEQLDVSTAQYAEDQKIAGRLVAPRPKNSTLASTRPPVTER